MALTDLSLRMTYEPDKCPDIVNQFYAPALAESISYDRTTFTFTAAGLVAAATGLANMLRNNGKIRIICDASQLDEPTCRAIIDGNSQALTQAIPPETLTNISSDDIRQKTQLELITWLIAQGQLEIKVAIPKFNLRPVFHAKLGILQDANKNIISFDGSPNETEAGWSQNYERFHLFCSWKGDEKRIQEDIDSFNDLWESGSIQFQIIPLPEEYSNHFKAKAPKRQPNLPDTDQYWNTIKNALKNDPATSLATVPAELWPHQSNFFGKHTVNREPCRLLIADEVGLGKTIQAGILLKTHLNQDRVKRVLVVAPKPACPQWQDELRRKFNISIPRLETTGQNTLVYPNGDQQKVKNKPWLADQLIVSAHWLRLHANQFLAANTHYDMVIVDEAHRARFSEVTNPKRRRPNQLLKLLQQLAERTKNLVLLTATPMQLHEAELHALVELLQPTGWSPEQFQQFHTEKEQPTIDDWTFMARLYRTISPNPNEPEEDLIHNENTPYVESFLSNNPQRIQYDIRLMQERSPAKRLMSRHTRQTLREYGEQNLIENLIPYRQVTPRHIPMSYEERLLYEGIDNMVSAVYADAKGINHTAQGFIMTSYRRRLLSSPQAYATSCQKHLDKQSSRSPSWTETKSLIDEEIYDNPDTDLPTVNLPPVAIQILEDAARQANQLQGKDEKIVQLISDLKGLKQREHQKVIIFTQFVDTMTYLLRILEPLDEYQTKITISGQDPKTDGSHLEKIKRAREAQSALLICTETAAESLNLQFCSAIVNYDMPWNPMKLEQRIGRIDRIGQAKDPVEVINLFYENTAESAAYQAMAERLENIHGHVGMYQPILYDPATLSQFATIIGRNQSLEATRTAIIEIQSKIQMKLDVLNSSLVQPHLNPAQVDMEYIQRALTEPGLMPDDWQIEHMGGSHWQVTRPDLAKAIVTTDQNSYEYDGIQLEWFGPGNPWFPI